MQNNSCACNGGKAQHLYLKSLWGEQGYLFILIGSDSDELRLRKNISPEGAVWKLHYVVSSHYMKSGLVFMHRIQNSLENPQQHS